MRGVPEKFDQARIGVRGPARRSGMKSAAYRIVPYQDGWGVEHDGRIAGRNAVKLGYEVSIMVEGSEQREPALGAR
jgi:hypothetical protein